MRLVPMSENSRSRKKGIFILGMHRSGTSATTRVINLLGADLGPALVDPAPDNRKGFWEHFEANQLDDLLLTELGRTWHDIREMPSGWEHSPEARQAVATFARLIERDFGDSPVWAIKDPRMCRLAPLWLEAARRCDVDVSVLLVVRNPLEVAESLRVRDRWVPGHSYLLWMQHLLEAERATRDRPRSVLLYDQLLEDWRGSIARVASELQVDWPRGIDQAGADIDSFLEVSERHFNAAYGGSSDVDGPQLPGLVEKLYEICGRISRGHGAWREVDALYAEYLAASQIYAEPIIDLVSRKAQAEERAKHAESIANAVDTVAGSIREQVADSLEAANGAREAANTAREAANAAQTLIVSQDEKLERLSALIEAASSQLATQGEMIGRLTSAAEATGDLLDSADVRSEALEKALLESDKYIDELLNSTSWRVTAPLRWARKRVLSKQHLRTALGRGVKATYDSLPLSVDTKLAVKGAVFRGLSPVLRNTNAYRSWKSFKGHPTARPAVAQNSANNIPVAKVAPRPRPPLRPVPFDGKGRLAFFTICSRNFTAYARTLADSIRAQHPDAALFVALCDERGDDYDVTGLPFELVELDQLDMADYQEMGRRYNITEFNTAIKPFVFTYLFERRGFEKVVYLDPDILVVSPLEEVTSALSDGAEAVLTPHILHPAEDTERTDIHMLQLGIYNLGFVALRNTARVREIVKWWERRLEFECVIRPEEGLFVDQKWADLLPSFIENTHILHHPGYNVAYWNLPQRQVTLRDDTWLVNGQRLRFVHFSGNKLEDPAVFSRHSWQLNVDNIGDLKLLLDEYRTRVFGNDHLAYARFPYSFSWNGASGKNEHTPQGATLTAQQAGNESMQVAGVPEVEASGYTARRFATDVIRDAGGAAQVARKAWRIYRERGLKGVREKISTLSTTYSDNVAREEEWAPKPHTPHVVKRAMFVDWSTPRPDQDAGSVTTFGFLKIFVELGYDVTFVPSDLEYLGKYSDRLESLGIRCLDRSVAGSMASHLRQYGCDYALVMVFRAPVAALYMSDIKRYAPYARFVLETADLHYLRDTRHAEHEDSDELRAKAQEAKEFELNIINAADVTIVVSPVEKEILSLDAPGADIRYLPVPLVTSGRPEKIAGFDERSGIMFVGGYRHLPNVDAMEYFCREIWPLVSTRLPGVEFLIVGSFPPPEIVALGDIPGVRVVGFVEDLDSLLSEVRLSVAPLRFGAGVKGKVATAMIAGVPVVGTTIAFEGMGFEAGTEVLVSDAPSEFADLVVQAYSDRQRWSELSANGMQKVDMLYTEEAGKEHLGHLLEETGLRTNDYAFERIGSYSAYMRHLQRTENERARRAELELGLIPVDEESFLIDGYCVNCDDASQFRVSFMYSCQTTPTGRPIPNWREHLDCVKCGFINRARGIMQLVNHVLHVPQTSRIYLTERTTRQYHWFEEHFNNVTGTEFFGPEHVRGSLVNGIRHEDLTSLTFADASFDLIVSLDVLEHVPDAEAAFHECFRTLAPGGVLLFTAPFSSSSPTEITRAILREDGAIEHLMEPEYHGNPVDPENGALCFRYFGWDMLEQLKRVGFEEAEAICYWSRNLAYLGGEQFAFVARKPR